MKLFWNSKYVMGDPRFDTLQKSEHIVNTIHEKKIPGVTVISPGKVREEQLALIHDVPYINAIKTGEPRMLAESQGFTWDCYFWYSVSASTGGMLRAVETALKEGCAGTLSSGLHHARRGRGEGYCTFNGLVLGALHALPLISENQCVLILDLDAHCGGGTYSYVASWTNAIHIDIATSEYDSYHLTQGRNSLNLVQSSEFYLPTLEICLEELHTVDIGLCIYNAGMDPYEGCDEGGLQGITFDILAERERIVFEWCCRRNIPIAFTMAGGYTGLNLSQELLTDLHLLTILQAQKTYESK